MDILEEKAKQGWDSGEICLKIGFTVVAYFSHSTGNGLRYDDAIKIANRLAEYWNEKRNDNQP